MYSELHQIALLGSDRARADAGLLESLAHFGIDINGSPEETLLQGLVFCRQAEKVGRHYGVLTTLPDKAPDQGEKICASLAIRALHQILDGLFPDALPEFLQQLRKAGQVLPPERLPDVFECALQESFLWPYLLPVIGSRGVWLQSQHPEWKNISAKKAGFEPLLPEETEAIRKKFKGFNKATSKELEVWLERVDPALWANWMDCDEAQVLKQLLSSSVTPGGFKSLTRAALAYERPAWLERLARFFLESPNAQIGMWDHPEGRLLIRALPGPVFNTLALEFLSRQHRPLLIRQFLANLIAHSLQPWEDRLVWSFLDHFTASIEQMPVWEGSQYRYMLQNGAYHCDPALLPALKGFSWPSDSPSWFRWSKEVEQFFRILHFRKDMLEAFGHLESAA